MGEEFCRILFTSLEVLADFGLTLIEHVGGGKMTSDLASATFGVTLMFMP